MSECRRVVTGHAHFEGPDDTLRPHLGSAVMTPKFFAASARIWHLSGRALNLLSRAPSGAASRVRVLNTRSPAKVMALMLAARTFASLDAMHRGFVCGSPRRSGSCWSGRCD
jgi:hypothetical protein